MYIEYFKKKQNKTINDIIYTEGSKATSVWLVFLGECVLLKNFKKLIPGEKINCTKQTTVMKISKGGFSSFEVLDPGEQKYSGTLVVNKFIINIV